MKWLEIIEVQSVGSQKPLIESNLKNLLKEISQNRQDQSIKIYNNVSIDTDISIHIYNESKEANIQGSPLGLRLVSTLKAFGLVNHTVWVDWINNKVNKKIEKE